jgi:hypothetical protein
MKNYLASCCLRVWGLSVVHHPTGPRFDRNRCEAADATRTTRGQAREYSEKTQARWTRSTVRWKRERLKAKGRKMTAKQKREYNERMASS